MTISEVNRLIALRAHPAISIYVGADARARPEWLREVMSRASELLASTLSRGEIDALLLPIPRSAQKSPPAAHGLALPPRDRTPGEDVDAWYRAVDDGLRAALWDRGDPVVLAGALERRERFAAVGRYPWILDAGVECDLEQVQVADLHGAAAAIVAAHRADVEAEASSQYASARRARASSEDLAEIARAAVTGRVPLLLHRRGAHVWGTMDPLTGECRVSGEPRPRFGEGDVIDDLTQLVLRAGGDVVEVAGEAMPTAAPLAAVVARPASPWKRSFSSDVERLVA